MIGFGQQTFNFMHNGLNREYIYYAPVNLPVDAPLVFVAHGFTGSAQGNYELLWNEFNCRSKWVLLFVTHKELQILMEIISGMLAIIFILVLLLMM